MDGVAPPSLPRGKACITSASPEQPPPVAPQRGAEALQGGDEGGDVAYGWLHRSIEALIKLPILPFDDAAASAFHRLRDARVRTGTMDLKIAAICLAHDATLLTRNLVDFD